MSRIGVMHITDTLDAGGAERVAVNLTNLLPRKRYRTYLCTTRRDGALAELVTEDVGRLRLERTRRVDPGAIKRLAAFINEQQIDILHAHGPALFIAGVASLLAPRATVIWHEHSGRYALEDRRAWLHRLTVRRIGGVIAVNRSLLEWSRRRLHVPASRLWHIPNFACDDAPSDEESPTLTLPGTTGARIVCVANFRAEKDHFNLLRAMALVVGHVPAAHLLLVGTTDDAAYLDSVRREIARRNLSSNVSLLGARRDVSAILRACDVAVLSSTSEGLPLALIEYGMAGLPSVTTATGQCAEVLDDGRAGLLVPPRAPDQLAEALLSLLKSPERRADFGEKFRRRVQHIYRPDAIIGEISKVYDSVLELKKRAG